MNTKFRFIDLFAGIGGFHIALHKIGGECVFASEIDKFARITYETNFKKLAPNLFEDNLYNSDITDSNLDYNSIPDFDVLCAGFPCQPFSNACFRKGFLDTRGSLFFNIEEIIKTKIKKGNPPKVLFLENVKGLLHHDKGNTLKTIITNLEKLGYCVSFEVLNSKYFGVPQSRERIFIVSWYSKTIKVKKFNFPYGINEKGDVIFEKHNVNLFSKKIKLGDILLPDEVLNSLEINENRSYTISEMLWIGHQRRKAKHIEKGYGFGCSVFNRDSQNTNTLPARYHKDGSEILISQEHLNKRPRKLHPIEAGLLQGYPMNEKIDNFKFTIPVSNIEAYKQFGNSVTVPVITAIANEINKQLL